jgi:MATE family multidrug resistance protein
MVVTTMSRTVMQFVDTLWLSRLGEGHAAAAGVGGMLCFSVIGFALGVTTVVNTFASQSLGRKEYDKCSAYAWQGVWLAIMLGAGAAVLWPAIPAVVRFFGHESELQVMERQFMQISLLSVAPSATAMALASFFNGVHRPKVAMWSAIAANLFNVVADYVLIFGALGFPRLEVAGAALATVAATVFRVGFLLVALWWGSARLQFASRRTWRVQPSRIMDLVRIGWPIGLQWAADVSAWAMFLTWLVGSFGKIHIAASLFVFQYLHVSFMPAVGVGIAMSAAVGRAIGEGRLDLVERRFGVGLKLCCGYMAVCGVGFFLFGEWLVSWFSEKPEVLHLGRWMMVFAAVFQVFDGMCVSYNSGLKGAGDTRWPAVVSVSLCWLVVVGGGWMAVQLWPGAKSFGPWGASTTFIIILSMVFRYRWRSGAWRRINLFACEREPAVADVLAATADELVPAVQPAISKTDGGE